MFVELFVKGGTLPSRYTQLLVYLLYYGTRLSPWASFYNCKIGLITEFYCAGVRCNLSPDSTLFKSVCMFGYRDLFACLAF